MTHVSTPLSPPPGPRWLYLVVYFVREYHDFLICLDLSQCRRDCRIRGSPSSAIGRRWKTSRQIYIHILALNEFSQSIFFSSGRRLSSSNNSFIVHCKRSSAPPTSFCWHVYAQPSRTITNWTNREARKKHRYQKRLSEKLTYLLATPAGYQNELLCTKSHTDDNNGLCDTWAGWNVNAGYHILLRLEGEFLCNVLISMQFCFTCLIVIGKQCLLLPKGMYKQFCGCCNLNKFLDHKNTAWEHVKLQLSYNWKKKKTCKTWF